MNAIEVKGLTYRYPDGRLALDGVDFAAAEGESVGLIGANGSGKTTLLLHLNGLLHGVGEVRVLGMDPYGKDRVEVRARVGVLFQDPDDQLFCPTVREDTEFGPLNLGVPREEARIVAQGALEGVGLGGHGDRSPHHLSAGEKKRAALAAVLAMRPAVLALDEPTAALDPKGRRELSALLAGFTGTRVIASHDLELVGKLCSRVVLLDAGKVVVSGPAGEILGNEELLRAHGL